jgi:hypothetical protein
MKEERVGSDSRDMTVDRLTRLLVKDLAELAQIQAKVTNDLVQLLDRLQGAQDQLELQTEAESADRMDRGVTEHAPAPPPVEESVAEEMAADVRAGADSETPPEVAEPAVVAEAEEAAEAAEPPPETVEETATIAEAGQPDQPEQVAGETEEEEDVAASPDATVLVLESQDARVGVLWDQVIQIGSLTTPTVPEKIETDHGSVDLVSLGNLLHGVSREEKYFVVLGKEGEKAAVACERMLGLGPFASASKNEQDSRIQVLQVGLLKTFAKCPHKTAGVGVGQVKPSASQKEEEERDRNGPRRALVAVRYLPARVAICRYLRGRGWQVGEAAGLEAAIVSLDLGRWDALFLEARGNGHADETEQALLDRVGELSIPVIRVGSRISGYPTQGGPSLMFPFSEAELDTILEKAGGRAGS